MKRSIVSLLVATGIAWGACAQGLIIQPGAALKATESANIVLKNGNLVNNGSSDLSNCNLYLTGNAAVYTGGTSTLTLGNLYINKPSSSVSLQHDLSIINNVNFINGLLLLNGHNLLLSSTGLLVGENETNHITGSNGGYVSITVNLNAPSGANPGNLGASITSSKNLGSVLIQRGHKAQTNNGSGNSILRYYNIQPSNNSSLNAVFRFTYLDAELNGLSESTLKMWKSTNGGGSWNKVNLHRAKLNT